MKNMKGKLYLIPTTLGDASVDWVIPKSVKEMIPSIRHFVVENFRTARRYLKKIDPAIKLDQLQFYELNKHSLPENVASYLSAIKDENIGIISEAGCPCVADPGSSVVRLAHQKNIQIVPLSGPSSILMALMASGFNGQNFAFNGYLPIKANERAKKIKQLEHCALIHKQTQIFIETPYRNNQLLAKLLENCKNETMICIAVNLTLENELIKTMSVEDWKKTKVDLHKKPAIFLMATPS